MKTDADGPPITLAPLAGRQHASRPCFKSHVADAMMPLPIEVQLSPPDARAQTMSAQSLFMPHSLLFLVLATAGCGFHPRAPRDTDKEAAVRNSAAQDTASNEEGDETTSVVQQKVADEESSAPAADAQAPEEVADEEEGWRDLYDGATLNGWAATRFGGEGEVYIEEGEIRLDFGQPLTGITYLGDDLPLNNYEIEVEAKRVMGQDFFCAITFPVDDSHCSLVVGGWGGSVVGISSIDHMDASENETTQYVSFNTDQWYRIRVRVAPGVLEAWIDDKLLFTADVQDRALSTRIEVDLSKPLGVCNFDTQAAIRKIRIRSIDSTR